MSGDRPLLSTVEHTQGVGQPKAAVIWLHGLGADGHDFESILPELDLPPQLAVRFVFPHAPYRPVTLNHGETMRAWYDVYGFDTKGPVDEIGIRDTLEAINALIIREEDRGITAEHIILAGFSQGGAVALNTGLRYARSLGGILALSTYLPLAEVLISEKHSANNSIAIFMAHGHYDPVIPFSVATYSRDYLEHLGYTVEWHEYAMDHTLIWSEISHIRQWLLERLAP